LDLLGVSINDAIAHHYKQVNAGQTPDLPREYLLHCVQVYNARLQEMDSDLCRLALFLNPVYREAVRGDFEPAGIGGKSYVTWHFGLNASMTSLWLCRVH